MGTYFTDRKRNAAQTFGHLIVAAVETTFLAAMPVLFYWLTPAAAYASEIPDSFRIEADSIGFQALFPVGVGDFDLSYQQNGSRLAKSLERLHKVVADPDARLGQIHIVGYASPEGGYLLNKRLAGKRADNLAAYLRTQIDIPDSLMLVESAGVDWHGLDRAVGESSLDNKSRVQYIIRNEPELSYNPQGALVQNRQEQLKKLDGGRTWEWMLKNLFPTLRGSVSVVYYIERTHDHGQPAQGDGATDGKDMADAGTGDDTLAATGPAEAACGMECPLGDVRKYPVFALRSNLLLPLLNVGAEMPVGNRWSIGADYYYPWAFRKADHKDCFQLTFFSGEARYWLGGRHSTGKDNRPSRLLGHSVAVYGAWGYYDFEHNFHGKQGDFWSAGLDYVYAVPVFRNRLHLEFQIAAGVIQSQSQPYNVFVTGGKAIREKGVKKNFGYFGPTKVGISIVLPVKARLR